MKAHTILKGDPSNLVEAGRKSVVYLATPYTHARRSVEQRRFERVTVVSGLLIKAGVVNFSPITQSHEQNRMVDLPGHWAFWQYIDTEFLHRCDEIYVLAEPGWQESAGVLAEIKIMRKLKKPIRYIQYLDKTDEIMFITAKAAKEIK
jgi:hypothetical protein